MAAIRQFIARSVNISLVLTERSSPSIQFLVTLIATNKIEITIGKLSTAIRILLLFALAAIPESRVSEAEKPIEPSTSKRAKSPVSASGFFNNVTKRRNPTKERRRVSKKL